MDGQTDKQTYIRSWGLSHGTALGRRRSFGSDADHLPAVPGQWLLCCCEKTFLRARKCIQTPRGLQGFSSH